METKLREDRPAEHVRRLTFDDPPTRNALTLELRAALVAALTAAAGDRDCRVVIVTGTGKVFASGSDIRMLAASTPEDVVRDEVRAIWAALLGFPKPLVIALNGHALGGGLELALCGDIILAARGVKLGNPEPKIGIMPGGGATQRLTRSLGWHRAMRMLLTAEP
ncbi:MAG TPA: enoyl-CoA hydratase/isomerase family protein, partial [Bauldia sp.]|nr:enoyl-CoA hydratase/isomerase family protein [Bauldia sp.]